MADNWWKEKKIFKRISWRLREYESCDGHWYLFWGEEERRRDIHGLWHMPRKLQWQSIKICFFHIIITTTFYVQLVFMLYLKFSFWYWRSYWTKNHTNNHQENHLSPCASSVHASHTRKKSVSILSIKRLQTAFIYILFYF